MRLPNHYGTVYKLSGKRRRPFVARKFVGKVLDEERKRVIPKYVIIGYYEKRSEALDALAAYNAHPVERSKTLAEAFQLWSVEYFPKIKTTAHYRAAWRVLEPLWDEPMDEIRLDDFQLLMRTSGKNFPTLRNVRTLILNLYDYAFVHEYIPVSRREILSHLDAGDSNPNALVRRPFTDAEIADLKLQDDPLAVMTMVLIFTGLRISELCGLTPDRIDYTRQAIDIRASKTAAGIREVPIADAAVPYVRKYMANRLPQLKYRADLKERYDHYPHDCRHTFATRMTEAGADQRIIDAIMGHSGGNTALKIYTHVSLEAKLAAVNLLEIC